MIGFMLVGGVALGGIPVEAQDQPAGGTEVVHNAPVPNGQSGADQQGTVTAGPAVPTAAGPPAPTGASPRTAPDGSPAATVQTVQNAPKPFGPAGPPDSTSGSVAANAPQPGQPAGLGRGDPITQAELLTGDGVTLGAATIRPAGRGVLLTINLTKAPPGTYTASLHRGSCARPGHALGRNTLALNPGVDGGAHGEGVTGGVSAAATKGAIVVVAGANGPAACGVLKALVG